MFAILFVLEHGISIVHKYMEMKCVKIFHLSSLFAFKKD